MPRTVSLLVVIALACARRPPSREPAESVVDAGSPVAADDGGVPPPADPAADAGTASNGGSAPADAGPAIPPDVPALTVLAPADAPPKPAVDPSCPAAAQPAAVHHPGACTILERRSSDTYRTHRRWASGIQIGETVEYWAPDFPVGDATQFNRSIIDWTLTDAGKPRHVVALDQFVYGQTPGGRRTTGGFTDFVYDANGNAAYSDSTYWVQAPSLDAPAPVHPYHDTYAGDTLGRVFLATRDFGFYDITVPLDRAFLFTSVPVTDLGHGQSFTAYPDRVVSSYTTGVYAAWGSTVSTQSFDERGIQVQFEQKDTSRFGDRTTTTWTYNYDGDRLTSIVSNFGDRTDYLYDARGNNVERITNSQNAPHYTTLFDSANNLVCELQTVGGQFAWVRHYDYGCF